MTIKEIQEEIIKLKKEKDFCVLAHAYVGQEILVWICQRYEWYLEM